MRGDETVSPVKAGRVANKPEDGSLDHAENRIIIFHGAIGCQDALNLSIFHWVGIFHSGILPLVLNCSSMVICVIEFKIAVRC